MGILPDHHLAVSWAPWIRGELEASIPRRFRKMLRQWPVRLAVRSGSEHLTYSDLDREASKIAELLLASIRDSEQLIAILFEPCIGMIAALLGILKAGKAFVPLDPLYPTPRSEFILKNSGVTTILTNDENYTQARTLLADGRRVLNIDRRNAIATSEQRTVPVSPESIACVLYTSGSTGTPKGVVHNHRNLLHSAMLYNDSLRITPTDRIALISAYTQTARITSIFMALLNGAMHVPIDIYGSNWRGVCALLEEEQITICRSSPTAFRHLMQALPEGNTLQHIRLVLLGGEPLAAIDVELCRKCCPKAVVVNNLSSTETLTYRQYFVPKTGSIPRTAIPTGYAVDGKSVMLIDSEGIPSGPNCPGRIAVSSRYNALGYWNDPELTKRHFSCESTDNSCRIFESGDLGVLREDLCLEFLGRIDRQVKISGSRVDLGEIELALMNLGCIIQAAVTSILDDSGGRRLIAYIVPNGSTTLDIKDIRKRLNATLPSYMLPADFIVCKTLPSTIKGNIDFSALELSNKAGTSMVATSASHSDILAILQAFWQEVLGVEHIDVDSEFIELGGDSLQAMRVLSRISATFKIDLPLRLFFESLTVKSLAALLVDCSGQDCDVANVVSKTND